MEITGGELGHGGLVASKRAAGSCGTARLPAVPFVGGRALGIPLGLWDWVPAAPRTAPRRPWALRGFKPSAAWVWGRVGRFLYRFWVCLPLVTSQDGSTCEKTSEGEKDGGFVNQLLRIFLMVLLMPLLLP